MSILYPWLEPYWLQLKRYQLQKRLPSGLMLVGDAGLGLPELARYFANGIFCANAKSDGNVCGQCSACLLFLAGNYPDYTFIEPEEDKKSIKIDVIRQLTQKLSLSRQYDKPRIVVISGADEMSHQASNSLLKTLEEPSENTTLILIAHKISTVPATIRSRCQTISVNKLDREPMLHWLEKQGCQQANQYLALSNGAPLKALNLSEMNALEARNKLFKAFLNLVDGEMDPLKFSELLISMKEFPSVSWIISWLSDVIKINSFAPDSYINNVELNADLKVLAKKLHSKMIYKLFDQLMAISQLDTAQINQQLLFDDFSINCSLT